LRLIIGKTGEIDKYVEEGETVEGGRKKEGGRRRRKEEGGRRKK
jgi:hypothetical protein